MRYLIIACLMVGCSSAPIEFPTTDPPDADPAPAPVHVCDAGTAADAATEAPRCQPGFYVGLVCHGEPLDSDKDCADKARATGLVCCWDADLCHCCE